MFRSRCFRLGWLILPAWVLGSACAPDMSEQPRYDPLEPSALFADGSSARPPVPGTISRGVLSGDPAANAEATDDQSGADAVYPFPVTAEVITRGRERFTIYCQPCHGPSGAGDGPVVQRGFAQPPPLDSERLREAPPTYIVGVIAEGTGQMPPYGYLVEPADRWAIAAFLRALQLNQGDPEALRQALESGTAPEFPMRPGAEPPARRDGLDEPSGARSGRTVKQGER